MDGVIAFPVLLTPSSPRPPPRNILVCCHPALALLFSTLAIRNGRRWHDAQRRGDTGRRQVQFHRVSIVGATLRPREASAQSPTDTMAWYGRAWTMAREGSVLPSEGHHAIFGVYIFRQPTPLPEETRRCRWLIVSAPQRPGFQFPGLSKRATRNPKEDDEGDDDVERQGMNGRTDCDV